MSLENFVRGSIKNVQNVRFIMKMVGRIANSTVPPITGLTRKKSFLNFMIIK